MAENSRGSSVCSGISVEAKERDKESLRSWLVTLGLGLVASSLVLDFLETL
jgi:hypothetical protein